MILTVQTERVSMSNEDLAEKNSWLDRLSQALLREPQDLEQLIQILREAELRGILDEDALSMIEGVLQISDLQVRDIMIPRSQMIVVHHNHTLAEMLPSIIKTQHSRFPVIEENKDEVIGILHAKDLLPYQIENAKTFDLHDIMRPAVFVPESKRLDSLLKEFRTNRNHMAIVVDEYGGVCGMVTIEDVIEQIIGEIEDEFDIDEELYIKAVSQGHYTVKAITPIDEFNEYFQTVWSDEDFDTVGGLIMQKLGHMPKRGESLTLDGYRFEILSADQRRIGLLRMTVL